MSSLSLFLRNYFRHPREIGALAATSASYSKLACAQVEWQNVQYIAELGAGDGAVTKFIVQNLLPHQKFLVFETNADLFAVLQERFKHHSNVVLIHDSAEYLEKYAHEQGISNFDAIFSEVPLVSLPKDVGGNIVEAVLKMLKVGGKYLQIQYSLLSLSKLKKLFKSVSLKFTPFNIPPAFLYICSNTESK